MHYHALHLAFFLLSCALCSVVYSVFSLSLFLSLPPSLSLSLSLSLSHTFSFLVMAPKKSIPSKNPIHHGSSSSSSSSSSDSVQFRDEKARDDFFDNFMTEWFIPNARSFYLTFQTLLYLVRSALGDGFLYVRNPRDVPTCSYRSFTPTCTQSIPLYLGLLWNSELHIL